MPQNFSTSEAIKTLLDAFQRINTELALRYYTSPLHALFKTLGCTARTSNEAVTRNLFTCFALFGQTIVCEEQEELHVELRHRLPASVCQLADQLRLAPLRLWQCFDVSPCQLRLALDASSRTFYAAPLLLQTKINLYDVMPGWVWDQGSTTYALLLAPVPKHVWSIVRNRSALSELELLNVMANGTLQLPKNPPMVTPLLPVSEDLINNLLRHINSEVVSSFVERTPRTRHNHWAKAMLAKGRTLKEMEPVVYNIRKLRFSLTTRSWHEHFRIRTPSHEIFEQIAPITAVLHRLGINPHGGIDSVAPDLLQSHPISMLTLAAEHPLWLHHDAQARIRSVFHWATTANAGDAEVIHQAFYHYESEQRWLFLVGGENLCQKGELPSTIPVYDEIRHALHAVFDPALSQQPLDTYNTPGLRRFAATPKGKGHTLAALPSDIRGLTAIQGIGPTTAKNITQELLTVMAHWRIRRANLSLTALRAAETAATTQYTLREGLDELASFFNF